MRTLRRLGATTLVLVLDADVAGKGASERGVEAAIENLLAYSVSPHERYGGTLRCQVAVLEAGSDPCDFLAERGAEAFREVLSGRQDVFDFKIDRVLERTDVLSVEARLAAARELMETASLADDPARRALYRQSIAERLGIPEETLRFRPAPRRRPDGEEAPEGGAAGPEFSGPGALRRRAERDLAGLLIRFPRGIGEARATADLDLLEDPVAREVCAAVEALVEGEKDFDEFDEKALLDRLSERATEFAVDCLEERDRERAESGPGKQPRSVEERLRKAAVALWKLQAPERLEELAKGIADAEAAGDGERAAALLRERIKLTRALAGRPAELDPDGRRRLLDMRERASRLRAAPRGQGG
jgi:DNA primase